MGQREDLLQVFYEDRVYAHRILFQHRHKDETPACHCEILELFYSDDPLVALEAFRGAAKSTLLEEYVTLKALFREIKFGIFVGNAYGMAVERLASVKQELTNNDMLIELFGDQHGSIWSEGEIVMSNGVKIQALGARQSMRGVKHNDERPDLAAVDDLEDEEMVGTPEAILKNKRWFNGTLRPALHPQLGKIRMVGTPLHPQALIESKMTDAKWKAKKYPILFIDYNGIEQSAWPSRFPLKWVYDLRQSYIDDGALTEFEQEYMCRSESAAMKPFKPEMMPVPATVRATWMAKTVVVDPARKGNVSEGAQRKLARTGYTVHSWTANRLIVHEAFGAFHSPDEIIDTIFKLDDTFRPVEIAVEKDGLEEFLMQPLRNAMLKRQISLPIIPISAPRNKIAFISGLQPFFVARGVDYAKPVPDLVAELLQFPTGRLDVPNALAYALRLRTGHPVYADFQDSHVAEALELTDKRPVYLAISARPTLTTAVMLQYIDGALRIIKDWVRNVPPGECLRDIVEEASIVSGGRLQMVAPIEQFELFNNYGLPGAARAARYELNPTASALTSMGVLKDNLRKLVRGEPGILIDMDARWVLNGLAGGYARKLNKTGIVEDTPADNQYRVMIEAIEAFIMWFSNMQEVKDNDPNLRYATTTDGRQYITTLPQRRPHGR